MDTLSEHTLTEAQRLVIRGHQQIRAGGEMLLRLHDLRKGETEVSKKAGRLARRIRSIDEDLLSVMVDLGNYIIKHRVIPKEG